MKKDVTTFTRYFILLIIVFIVWLFLLHDLRQQTNFRYIFGNEESSL